MLPAHSKIEISSTFGVPRSALFAAFSNLEQLERWWGPHGFTNASTRFEFENGGTWEFTMESAEGMIYPNVMVFQEIVPSELIVVEHIDSVHPFSARYAFSDHGDGSRLDWVMENHKDFEFTREFLETMNQQNIERLAAVLGC